MGLVEDELQDVRNHCQNQVEGSKLVTCVRTMVRVEIRLTKYKHLIVCLQFPRTYPSTPILIELKSKTLSSKLLEGLTTVSEDEAKKSLGRPQILKVLKFLRQFLDDNPLSCCYDEITAVKQKLSEDDDLRLKQKSSSLSLRFVQGLYFIKAKIGVPNEYPEKPSRIEELYSNFPPVLVRWLEAQSSEIARRCTEPPLRKTIKKGKPEPPFELKPSVQRVVDFLLGEVKHFPKEICPVCAQACLPQNPEEVVTDETADQHVERVYCGHLYHQECLIRHMKTPPFHGGKICAAAGCGRRVYHDKWRVGEKLAEDRWAHQQARERELKEVEEFFD